MQCVDIGKNVYKLEACDYENAPALVAVAHQGGLSLIHAQKMTVDLSLPAPAAHALSWNVLANTLALASVADDTIYIHLFPNDAQPYSTHISLPTEASAKNAAGIYDCCLLDDTIAFTGENCFCHIARLDLHGQSYNKYAEILRTIPLESEGVAVAKNAKENKQLIMIAEGRGAVHFVDLRSPGVRPTISLQYDGGELADADWSSHDPYLVGGVSSTEWVGWDLRYAESQSASPQTGFAHAKGGAVFRWAPDRLNFATAGTGNETKIYSLKKIQGREGGMWNVDNAALVRHNLQTRVGSVTWLHTDADLQLVGSGGSKVFKWEVSGHQGSDVPQEMMLL